MLVYGRAYHHLRLLENALSRTPLLCFCAINVFLHLYGIAIRGKMSKEIFEFSEVHMGVFVIHWPISGKWHDFVGNRLKDDRSLQKHGIVL